MVLLSSTRMKTPELLQRERETDWRNLKEEKCVIKIATSLHDKFSVHIAIVVTSAYLKWRKRKSQSIFSANLRAVEQSAIIILSEHAKLQFAEENLSHSTELKLNWTIFIRALLSSV